MVSRRLLFNAFVRNMKEGILRMAKPKNRPETPQEFSYEDELQTAEARMAQPEPAKRPKGFQPGHQDWRKKRTEAAAQANMVAFDYADVEGGPAAQAKAAADASPLAQAVAQGNIYLVEGQIRLDRQNQPPVVADQRRIVYANSDDQALQKFMAYFTSMNSPTGFYSVVSAGCSEAIR